MKRNVAKRALCKVKRIFLNICNTVHFLILNKKEVLVVNAWMTMYNENPRHFNLGDELNFYLIKALTSYKIFNYTNLYVKYRNFCCIGSIIDSDMLNKNSIVWGTGAIEGIKKISTHPQKVCAVRGKLTREYLQSQGIDCPAVYGDPALLLPKIYQPSSQKIYKYGIIPHYVDQNNPLIDFLVSILQDKVQIIEMQGYTKWTDVIDQINQCQYIISSSLHGIIISDAYKIPNVWMEFSDKIYGGSFKFKDYFSSVERLTENPIRMTYDMKRDAILVELNKWKPISIDLKKLIDACPFPHKDII